MGIKISQIVPKKEISFNELKGKKIAVDASNMLYQFVTSIRQPDGTPLKNNEGKITSHLVGIFSRIPNLMDKGLKLIFVFDGKPPKLKGGEQKERNERKKIAEEKFREAKEILDEENMLKYSKQSVKVTQEMVEESKRLLQLLGIPIIQAPSEAEAQAAYMSRKDKVWGVASSDYDCLVYGCKRMITNLTVSKRRKIGGSYQNVYPEIIRIEEVLNTLGIDKNQLLTLSILVGTDYNPKGIKGIGQKKALKLVKEKSREDIFKELNYDYKKIVNTFEEMKTTDDYKLEWKELNIDGIKEMLIDEFDFSEERIDKTIKKISKKDVNQKGLGDFL